MIRRTTGTDFWLITQQAHADAAAVLAGHFGHDRDGLYAPPADRDRFRQAVSLHDAGWEPIDADLPLNAAGLPLDVFDERRFDLSARIGLDSARRAAAVDPYAGLLTSLHFCRFSREPADSAEQFAMLEYQQDQAELQDELRQALGLSQDDPDFTTDAGLAVDPADPREHGITADFRRLRACDMLSLCACRTDLPTKRIGPVPRSDAGRSLPIEVSRENWNPTSDHAGDLVVHPWPFKVDAIELEMAYRPVPATSYPSPSALADALASSVPGTLRVTVRPRNHAGSMVEA